jgi:hypothetical protein
MMMTSIECIAESKTDASMDAEENESKVKGGKRKKEMLSNERTAEKPV